jgi:hypothetical protein
MRTAFLLAAALLAGQLIAAETPWETNLKAATEKAVAENKDVILLVGSSIQSDLLKKTLSEGFAPETHILVHSNGDDVAAISAAIGASDPTLVFLDQQGRPYGVVSGYNADAKPSDYQDATNILNAMKAQRDALFAAAEMSEGVKKAAFLHAAMVLMLDVGLFQNGKYYGYDAIIKEIKTLDTENAAQLKSNWAFYDMAFVVQGYLDNVATDPRGPASAIELINKYVEEFKTTDVPMAQKALYGKAAIYHQNNDKDGTIAALIQMRDLDPNSELGKAAAIALAELQKEEPKK